LTLPERLEKINKWRSDIIAELSEGVSNALRECEEAAADIRSLRLSKQISAIQDRSVILCTTTGAAKQEELLKIADCDVVLVEEAGEILETHVLSAIYDAKALIMIGDHQQLRPKVCVALSHDCELPDLICVG